MSLRSEVIRIIQEYFSSSKKITELPSLPSNVANGDLFEVVSNGTNYKALGSQLPGGSAQVKVIQVAFSDTTTAITAGTAKVTFRMPYAMTVTAVRASLGTTQASGNIFTVDINESGTTILSTKITIDNGEKTSTTAAIPPVISDSALADDAEITIDVDQVGNGTAIQGIITLIGS